MAIGRAEWPITNKAFARFVADATSLDHWALLAAQGFSADPDAEKPLHPHNKVPY
jgi:hypothetical protein